MAEVSFCFFSMYLLNILSTENMKCFIPFNLFFYIYFGFFDLSRNNNLIGFVCNFQRKSCSWTRLMLCNGFLWSLGKVDISALVGNKLCWWGFILPPLYWQSYGNSNWQRLVLHSHALCVLTQMLSQCFRFWLLIILNSFVQIS